MRFDHALARIRTACDPRDESQRGTGDNAKVSRQALREMLRDWERLDREVRSLIPENAALRARLAAVENARDDLSELLDKANEQNGRNFARAERAEAALRMIVSHATGGETTGDGMSVNDISVRITAFRNVLWEEAKKVGAREAEAALTTARRDALEGAALVEAAYIEGFGDGLREAKERGIRPHDKQTPQQSWSTSDTANALAAFDKEPKA